jgi:putative transposase
MSIHYHDFAPKVAHLLAKGGQQGRQYENSCLPAHISIENRDLKDSDVWLSIKDVAHLTGDPERTIKHRCKHQKYVSPSPRLVSGNGGLQYRISLSSLPESAQMAWREQHGLAPECDLVEDDQAVPSFDQMSVRASEEARLKYDVIRVYQEAISEAKHGLKLAAKEAFEQRFNGGEWPVLLEKIGPISWRSIDTHWLPKLREAGGRPSSLAPQYKYTRTGRSVVGISALQAQIVLGYYQNPNALKISEIVRRANRKLHQMGKEKVSESRVRRFLKEYTADHGAAVVMARQGEKAYEDTCAPWIKRNPELILPGDLLVADGHVLNFTVQDPLRRKARRMTLIFHEDMRSKAVVGWEIMPTESTQAIAASFRRAMLWMGYLLTGDEDAALVPRSMMLDNGKAFKSKYFSGLPGTLKESGVAGLFEELRPYGFAGVQFARAYHGQTKPVERTFGMFAELERGVASYTGTSIAMKPARLMRGEFLHRDLAELLQANVAPTLEEAHLMVAMWVHEHHQMTSSKSRYLEGKSRYEVLEEGFVRLMERDGEALKGRIISESELRYLMMRETTRTLHRNGLSLFGRQYLSPELHDMAKGQRELVIRYDLDRLDRVAVYHPNGEYLCIAPEWCADGGVHPAVKLLGSGDDEAKFEAAARVQAEMRNGTKTQTRRSILAAAEAGFGGFVGREIAPAVARLKARGEGEERLAAARQKTGTDDGREIELEQRRRRLYALMSPADPDEDFL